MDKQKVKSIIYFETVEAEIKTGLGLKKKSQI